MQIAGFLKRAFAKFHRIRFGLDEPYIGRRSEIAETTSPLIRYPDFFPRMLTPDRKNPAKQANSQTMAQGG